jgi:hypothetical protein
MLGKCAGNVFPEYAFLHEATGFVSILRALNLHFIFYCLTVGLSVARTSLVH